VNPALGILLVLSVAGRVIRRDAWGTAWLVIGLAGVALLSPALLLHDGVPSPAGALADFAPWQHDGDPHAGNRVLVDVTYQIQPWLIFLRSELLAGRLPFWNPHQFAGAPFWSNGQSAPLFPLHLLFVALPLQLGLVILPWCRILVAGLGARALALELGVSSEAALLAGLVFPLAGMPSSFLLYPMANAVALAPWVLLAVLRLDGGRRSIAWLAIAVALQGLGGHPETLVHTAMLGTILFFARRPYSLARAGGFIGGWALGGALAAAHLVPVALNILSSDRWLASSPAQSPPLALLARLPFRLLLPDLFGNPVDGSWWGPFQYNATAAFAGIVALALAVAALGRVRRDAAWRAVLALLLFCCLAAWHAPGVRDLLELIPVVRVTLHHRLLFGVDLALAILAAAGIDELRAGRRRWLGAGLALVACGYGAAWLVFSPAWANARITGVELAWTAWGVVAVSLLLVTTFLAERQRTFALTCVVPILVVAELCAAHARTNPGLPVGQLYPRTGAVRFLAGREGRVAGTGYALRPNAALVYGLYDLRGDDTLRGRAFGRVYDSLAEPSPFYFRPIIDWQSAWLDRLALRWVVAPPASAPAGNDWALRYDGADARVFERPSALPVVRWEQGDAPVTVVRRDAGAWDLAWPSPGSGRLVIAESWDAGWRASINGQKADVEAKDGLIMAVSIPSGPGKLSLRYVPVGLLPGLAVSLAALTLLMVMLRRRDRADAPRHEQAR